ncbi:uncharacterized protein LOC113376978 isoform X2 [Ctenocephalides felis]|uniref:uncharacterized protein LOC113376978 isoform X2 n=1 Tax=Ctenocephalides felis TaxID=7515 RepID=UPI000E6E4D76|nr:uncharacterized protein LOC113376978 isoform X2 [Ctenocephalides felis]
MPRNDFLGLTGMVKITNPDEVLNQDTLLGSTPPNTTLTEDQTKRLKINANPHRSLPDIPICSESNAQHATSEVPEVVTELYATVGDKVFLESGSTLRPEVQSSSNRNTTHHNLDHQQDDATSSYATVSNFEHPYNRVQIPDHPYAQVQNSRAKTASMSSAIIIASSVQNNNNDTMPNHSAADDDHIVDIPAAPAIAGRVSANQELPYMTPPIQANHFSGDSQDSSKGYTSISVREPLVNILVHANQNPSRSNQELIDSHYTTVSDDSDEMYAAIEEQPFSSPFEVYTSVSETYAQIHPPTNDNIVNDQPVPSAHVSIIKPEVSLNNNLPEVKDAGGSTVPNCSNTTQVLQLHTRQDSSSSCVSSVGNLESPKPMKRQANSPLPLPPSNPLHFVMNKQMSYNDNNKTDFYNNQDPVSIVETISQSESDVLVNGNVNSTMSPLESLGDSTNQNLKLSNLILSDESEITGPITDLEGMYAKVVKKHKLMLLKNDEKLDNLNNRTDTNLVFDNEVDESVSNKVHGSSSNLLPQIILNKSRNSETKSINNLRLSSEEKDPGYETICDKKKLQDTNSCIKNINDSIYRENYNTVPEILQSFKSNISSEISQNISDSCLDGDPNYEELNLPGIIKSDIDAYSTVPDLTSINDSSNQIQNEIKCELEHNYESVTQCNLASDNETNYDSIKSINTPNSVHGTLSTYQCEKTQPSKKIYSDAVDDYFQV